MNYQTICRICINEKSGMLSIYESYNFSADNCEIFKVITNCASVKIQKFDGFSQQICRKCLNHLSQAYSFKKLCEDSDYKFRNGLIESDNIEIKNELFEESTKIIHVDNHITENADDHKFENDLTDIKNEIIVEDTVITHLGSHIIENADNYKVGNVLTEIGDEIMEEDTNITHVDNHITENADDCKLENTLTELKNEFSEEDTQITHLGNHIAENTNETSNMIDDDLAKLKREFEAEETTIQYGVLGNQLKEENFDEPQLSNGEFSENHPKMETTINDMCYQKIMQVEDDEIESESTSSDSSNIKSEFEEEETRIQYGAFENQLHEETFDKSTKDIPKLPMLDGELTKSFQKTELPISNMFSKEDIELARSQKTDSTTVKGDLNRHNRTHTGKRPYKCETKGDLNRHNRTHTGDRSYKCETCGKYFTQKTALNVHNRTHTEDKPCKCETCGKCFTLMGNLNRHYRRHTGEKPYKCETCSKCFSEKADLNRHHRTHTGKSLINVRHVANALHESTH